MALDRVPRRHIVILGDFGDEARALLHVVVSLERERRRLAGAMALGAVVVNERRDVFGERRLGLGGGDRAGLKRGKTGAALLDIISLVPVAGKTVKAGKVTSKATKWAAKYAEVNKTAIKAYNTGDKTIDVARGAAGIEKEMEGAEFFLDALNYKSDDGSYYVDNVIDTLDKVPGQEESTAALRELVKEIRG